MRLDVRLVIGAAFFAIGLLLTGYGIAHEGEPRMQPTGIPITLLWGFVLLAFSAFMLWRWYRSRTG